MTEKENIFGCLLGTAVGDALGLSCEGMSKQRQLKLFSDINRYHFFFNKGMISDDTEHICMTAQALIESGGDVTKFSKSLGWKLRFWLLGLPAGIGLATLKSIIKLWLGFSPNNSGVFSAGNGPAMRSPIIGVCYGNDMAKVKELVLASTLITHTDPKAFYGSLAVALAAYMSSKCVDNNVDCQEYFSKLEDLIGKDKKEFLDLINKTTNSVLTNQTTEEFAKDLGIGNYVSGYIYHTVPVVLHCWLMNQNDYKTAIQEVIRCGGDTDTTAAILGAIIGSRVKKEGMPQAWIDNLFEWPRSVNWIEKVSEKLSFVCLNSIIDKPVPLSIIGVFIRNIFFMLIVIIHIIRRSLPPY